jgi:hypothetical protein
LSHNDQYVIGRQSAGTARFWEERDGLHADADAPDTTWANDMLASMYRKDLDQASAAFWILQSRWEKTGDGVKVRVVERALLRDASVVSFAAYEASSASVQQPAAIAATEVYEVTDLDTARLELLRLA